MPENNILCGGDYNCTLTNSDRISNTQRCNDKSNKTLHSLITNFEFVDTWRKLYQGKEGFTFYDKRSNSKSRLDYFLALPNPEFSLKKSFIMQA